MPNFNEKKIDNPSAATFRTELENYFKHVLEHDPNDLQFTVMLAGHAQDGGTHMCTMVGGPPPMVARAVLELMDTLVQQDPAFAIAFLLGALNNLKATGVNTKVVPLDGESLEEKLASFDLTGGEDVEKAVNDFIASLQGGNDDPDSTPPKGTLH